MPRPEYGSEPLTRDTGTHMQTSLRTLVPTARYFLDLISCRRACPVRTNAGAYVRAAAEGDYALGYAVAGAPNPWVSVCARVCAHPCESQCRRGRIDEPIAIRALKRAVTERHGVESVVSGLLGEDPVPIDVAVRIDGQPARVAVVGAGPAGLSCAAVLAYLGYQVTVFESAPVVGGMLYQGIPEYRLPRDVIRAEVERILGLGVRIESGRRLGTDFSVAELRRRGFGAVFLAFGATRGRDLSIQGAELDGIVNGVDFLLNANLGYRVALGKRVVVVGGGNVAIDVARTVLRYGSEEGQGIPPGAEALLESWGYDNTLLDAARTALRLGARHVTVVCLERRQEMPASNEEIAEAAEEGIGFLPGRGPKRFLGKDGKVVALETQDVASVFDEHGRFNPKFVPNSDRSVGCDTVVLAIGQTPDLSSLSGDPDIRVTPRGLVEIDARTLATSVPGVYCGGDLAFGPRIVVEAAGDGKRAALAIHEHLGGGSLGAGALRFRPVRLTRWMEGYDRIPRQKVPVLPVQRRSGFREVEEVYATREVEAEGARCLMCHVSPVFDSDRCILCGGCVDVCPERCLRLARVDRLTGTPELQALQTRLRVSGEGGAILKNEERCIRCGLCVERCPAGAIVMAMLEVDDTPLGALRLFADEMGAKG